MIDLTPTIRKRWLAAATACLLLVAVGPVQATPVEQEEDVILLGSDTVAGDRFGNGVGISGDVMVVGAPYNANTGSAYVFRWTGSSWLQEAQLSGDDTIADDYFGIGVAVSGDTIVAGAYGDDDNGSESGSAYVFRWNGSFWVQEAKLVASDGTGQDYFGIYVALDGDVAVISAYGDSPGQVTAGSAYIFRRNGTTWTQEAKVSCDHPNPSHPQFFGSAVAVSGDVVVVGAKWHRHGAYGVAGAAFVYRWDGEDWDEEAELFSSDLQQWDWFGSSVGVDGDTIVVGRQEGGGFCGGGPGAAYVFEWDGTSWDETAKLEASDGKAGDRYGGAVAIDGDAVLVGAWDWVECGNPVSEPGRAYLYRWDGVTWIEETKLVSSNGTPDDRFGLSVGLSGDAAVVGSYYADQAGTNAGAAYVYSVPPPVICPGDIDGTGVVDASDLMFVLAQWGTCPPMCVADVTGDGEVSWEDLLVVLASWGPCGT